MTQDAIVFAPFPGAIDERLEAEDKAFDDFSWFPRKDSAAGSLFYVRMTDAALQAVVATGLVEVLGVVATASEEAVNILYNQVFSDSAAAAKYRAVYDPQPYEQNFGEEGETITFTPSPRIGAIV